MAADHRRYPSPGFDILPFAGLNGGNVPQLLHSCLPVGSRTMQDHGL
jgi:hypothetical protein